MEQLQVAIFERIGVHPTWREADEEQQRQSPQLPPRPAILDSLSRLFEHMSSSDPLARSVSEALRQPFDPTMVDAGLQSLLHSVLGPMPRILMGLKARAAFHSMRLTTCRLHTSDIAAAVHVGCRIWCSGLINKLRTEIELKRLHPIALITYVLYDETPLPLRTLISDGAMGQDRPMQSLADSCGLHPSTR